MYIEVLQAKIHNVRLTQTELNYTGSITIDMDLVDAAGMIPNQKVLIVNNNNGERFETYIIEGERGSGIIGLNGAAARKGQIGDELIIMTFISMSLEEAKKHWRQFGCTSRENRYIECDMKRNTEYNQDEAATNILKAYNKHHDDYERNVTQISTDQNHVYDVDGNMESTQLQLESAYMKYMGLTFGAIAIGIVSLKFLN